MSGFQTQVRIDLRTPAEVAAEKLKVAPTDIEVLRTALKEAEDELCQMGHVLVDEGWNVASVALSLDVIRIALYGTDGAGNGLEGFERACDRVRELRAQESAT